MSGDCGAIFPAAWPSIGVFSIAQTLSANEASRSRCGEGRPRVKEQQSSYAPTSIQGKKGDPDMKNKVLVAGASGLIGVAAIEAFLSAGWEVVGVSRRKPYLPSGRDFDFISVDLRDRSATHEPLSSLADVTHVAYAAI